MISTYAHWPRLTDIWWMFCGSLLLAAPPLAILLFYGSANVRETCLFRDPQPRWTDRCPLPVLTVSAALAFQAYLLVGAAIPNAVTAFFGRILFGTPATIALVAGSVLTGYLSWAS